MRFRFLGSQVTQEKNPNNLLLNNSFRLKNNDCWKFSTQTLEAKTHEISTIRPLTSYCTNHEMRFHRCFVSRPLCVQFQPSSILSYFHHHHHDVRLARISLTLSLHVSLSFIASGRSSRLHPVSSHSCCMYVRAGRPAFDWPYAGVHRSTSLTISSLLLQQSPVCLVRLACIVFVIFGRWPYSWCLLRCCCQDLFNIARNILV